MTLDVRRLGTLPYEDAHALQSDLLRERRQGQIPDTLLLVEHPAVITLGRGIGAAGNVLDPGDIPVLPIERGGDVTLHLPGQIVGYLIRSLPPGQRDLHAHLRLLEEIVIATLIGFGLDAGRVAGKTGVWVGPSKLASIGVACRQWVTWHGFGLNVDCDLAPFSRIKPCGFESGVMSSMARELGHAPDREAVYEALASEAREQLAAAEADSGAQGGRSS